MNDLGCYEMSVDCPRVTLTKSSNGECGLVTICPGKLRKHHTTRTAILLAIVDQVDQNKKWSKFLDTSLNDRRSIQLSIPKSSIDHQLLVTVEHLCEVESKSQEHLTFVVESTERCVAMTTSGNDLNDLILLRMSNRCDFKKVEVSHHNFCPSVSLEVRKNINDDTTFCLSGLPLELNRILFAVHPVHSFLPKSYHLITIPLGSSTIEIEHPERIDIRRKYRLEFFGLAEHSEAFWFYVSKELEAELTVSHIVDLHRLATSFAGSDSTPIRWLYRNKPRKYFNEILITHHGIMKPYLKDNSGDPGSPINSRLNGLFFTASVKPGSKTGEPDDRSSFGDTRLCIPPQDLHLSAQNVYFVDFYCMKTTRLHYVTLVITAKGSEADEFCARRLLPLSFYDSRRNPFLFYDSSNMLRVSARRRRVECMFTEDIDINGYSLIDDIKTRGKGRTTKGGRPKNLSCDICNVSPMRKNLAWNQVNPVAPIPGSQGGPRISHFLS